MFHVADNTVSVQVSTHLLYKYENQGTAGFSYLAEVTQLLSGGAGAQTSSSRACPPKAYDGWNNTKQTKDQRMPAPPSKAFTSTRF